MSLKIFDFLHFPRSVIYKNRQTPTQDLLLNYRPQSEWVHDFIAVYQPRNLSSNIVDKIDIYSFGVMVSQIIIPNIDINILPSMRDKIQEWAYMMIHPNPKERFTPQAALNEWNQIFRQMAIPVNLVGELQLSPSLLVGERRLNHGELIKIAIERPDIGFEQLVNIVFRYYGKAQDNLSVSYYRLCHKC